MKPKNLAVSTFFALGDLFLTMGDLLTFNVGDRRWDGERQAIEPYDSDIGQHFDAAFGYISEAMGEYERQRSC